MRIAAFFLSLRFLHVFAQWRHTNVTPNAQDANQPGLNCRPYLLGKPSNNVKVEIVQTVIPIGERDPYPSLEYFDGINVQPTRPLLESGQGQYLLAMLKTCYMGSDFSNINEMGKWFVAHPVGKRWIMGICYRVGTFQPFIFKLNEDGTVSDFHQKLLDKPDEDRFLQMEAYDAREILVDKEAPEDKPALRKVGVCMHIQYNGNGGFTIKYGYRNTGFCKAGSEGWDATNRCYDDADGNLKTLGNRNGEAKNLWFSGDYLMAAQFHAYRPNGNEDYDQGQRFLLRDRAQTYEECFFSPVAKNSRQSDVRVFVSGTEATKLVEEGPKKYEPIASPQSHDDQMPPCQPLIFPPGGNSRIFAYEGELVGDHWQPQISVYSGDAAEPLFRGDLNQLSLKCSVDENSEETAAAHFGLRALSMETVVVFCQNGYGATLKNKAYFFVMRFNMDAETRLAVASEMAIDMPAESPKGSKFLDARGVIHLQNGADALFVQIQPCYVWKVKDNTVVNATAKLAKCTNDDLSDVPSFTNNITAINLIASCEHKSCYIRDGELKIGPTYEPTIYRTEEMYKDNTKAPVMFAHECIESHEELTNYGGRTIRTFQFVDTSYTGTDKKTPCLALSDYAHHAHLIYESTNFTSKLCTGAGFKLGTGTLGVAVQATTISPRASFPPVTFDTQPTAAPLNETAHCTVIWIATPQGVMVAGIIAGVCFLILLALVIAGSVGKAHYLKHKDEQGKDSVYTTVNSQSMATTPSMMPSAVGTPTPIPSPLPQSPAPEANLFSVVGEFKPT